MAQEEDEDDQGAEDADAPMQEVRTGTDADAGEEARAEGLQPQEIDAYWLQRRVAGAFPTVDAAGTQKMAEQVFSALQVGACLAVGLADGCWVLSCPRTWQLSGLPWLFFGPQQVTSALRAGPAGSV